MDLALYAQVLWRSRVLVVVGFAAAVLLAVLAMASVSFHGVSPQIHYRSPVLYSSNVDMLVTQTGFPEGRTVFDTTPTTLPSGQVVLPNYADPSRFTDLAALYAQLVMGDAVQRQVFGPKPPVDQLILSSPMAAPSGSGFLPLFQITGVDNSPTGAMALADRAATAFSTYLTHEQQATGTASSKRVIVQRVAGPLKPGVYQGRKKVRAIFIFLLISLITVAAAFIRENMRNRPKASEVTEISIAEPYPVRSQYVRREQGSAAGSSQPPRG